MGLMITGGCIRMLFAAIAIAALAAGAAFVVFSGDCEGSDEEREAAAYVSEDMVTVTFRTN